MKKIMLILALLNVLLAENTNRLEKTCFEVKICEDDYECRVQECFIKNTTNLLEAFRFDLDEESKAKREKYYKPVNAIYKQMLNEITLPKYETKIQTLKICLDKYCKDFRENNITIKYTIDELYIEYNLHDDGIYSKTYKKYKNAIKVINESHI
ncbi:hypothetical protein DCO58_01850 [Helicobacter saguini]|uniref:Uncharacterized protein n=1 Tax=Helicobacter saguini TaxID=1548018 RepID=A0A347VRJ7_9HELI|nr:hypothetical protein [Helicobacter saguini]MWV62875.1 hypothetical protein [Helicobacter saguini]MWV66455.1 hypothetical protein [Helicobacter saguini]MWV68804.1 hypothetical protein [Helicobacter saguini]MWV71641.1 hypothetical protein [Helicobacter saguini]TLD94444.1 hypothetical protein LS64_005820 [Helicobacter saguini]